MKNYDHLNHIIYDKYNSLKFRSPTTEKLKDLSVDELRFLSKKLPKLDINYFVDFEVCKKVFPKEKKYIIINTEYNVFRSRFTWEKPDPLSPEKYIHCLSISRAKQLESMGRLLIEVKDVQDVKNYFTLKDIIT